MLNPNDCKIALGTWADLGEAAKGIREVVFIQEQQIDPHDEWDEQDSVCLHFVVYVHDQAVATARLLANHCVGRVAVLKEFRGLGLGQRLMQMTIDTARQQQRPYVQLSSQVHAIGFYQALGFEVDGEVYLDCGIPHQNMRLDF